MPETIAPSPATSFRLSGNSAGSAPSPTVGAKPLKCNGTLVFRGERRRALRAPRKTRGLLTHSHLRCNMTDRPAEQPFAGSKALRRALPLRQQSPDLPALLSPRRELVSCAILLRTTPSMPPPASC